MREESIMWSKKSPTTAGGQGISFKPISSSERGKRRTPSPPRDAYERLTPEPNTTGEPSGLTIPRKKTGTSAIDPTLLNQPDQTRTEKNKDKGKAVSQDTNSGGRSPDIQTNSRGHASRNVSFTPESSRSEPNHTSEDDDDEPKITPQHKVLYRKRRVNEIIEDFWRQGRDNDRKAARFLGQMEAINKEIAKLNRDLKILDKSNGQIPTDSFKEKRLVALLYARRIAKDPSKQSGWKSLEHVCTEVQADIIAQAGLMAEWTIPDDFVEIHTGIDSRKLKGKQRESPTSDDSDESSGNRSQSARRDTRDKGKAGKRRHEANDDDKTDSDRDYGDDDEEAITDNGDVNNDGEDAGYGDSDVETDLDDSPAGLRKAVERIRGMPLFGVTQAYKKCGRGAYQLIVRYGSEDAPTYRIVPGQCQTDWTLENTINVKHYQRGPLRVDDEWAYTERDIEKYFCVAWKPHPDDLESGEPLVSLDPANWDDLPPLTYTGVLWKDGETTWEHRTSMNRFIGNKKSLAAAHVILHRAKVQEKLYKRGQARLNAEAAATRTRARAPTPRIHADSNRSTPELYRDDDVAPPRQQRYGSSPIIAPKDHYRGFRSPTPSRGRQRNPVLTRDMLGSYMEMIMGNIAAANLQGNVAAVNHPGAGRRA